jgi:hypothetical protein
VLLDMVLQRNAHQRNTPTCYGAQADGKKDNYVQQAEDFIEGKKGTAGGKYDSYITQADAAIDKARLFFSRAVPWCC